VIDLQAAKLRILTDELAAARIRATQFELDYNNLKAQLERLHPVQKPADTCPFCRRATGDLIDLKPHPELEIHGIKIGYYKCSACGKKYDKQLH
jgi:ribosomal protein L37AE/L43A